MRFYVFAAILVLAGSVGACTDSLTGPDPTEPVMEVAALNGSPSCIIVTVGEGAEGYSLP